MTLSTGTKLAHYEIFSQLGKGGMGEVYRAKDQKLGRDVAIKVLPEEFARDADRVARFQREAKLLASLNHPNIAAIYGLEESEGTHFLVMELVGGITLQDYIAGNAGVPAGKKAAQTAALPGLLKLALQIAEALEAAHEKGVIHRDLKPANIKVTPEGKVKVLDFGLAKAFAGEQEDMNLSNSPTLSVAATQQGVILGTAAYMSPEQARGKPVDKRTDIWAFGVVLFEMLTGRSVFSGDDVSQTLARVLERDPDFSKLPPNLHPKIIEMLERCLEKDARNRYSGIADARVDIQRVLADPGGVLVQPVTTAKPRKKLRLGIPWVAAAVVAAVMITALAVWYLRPAEPRQVIRFDYNLPEDQEFTESQINSLAVSADGTKIVYVANNQLYLKNLDEFSARPIQGTDEDPVGPFFSPDGRWIGYSAQEDGQLKKISIMGGTPVTLCEDTVAVSATWGTDDMILFGGSSSIMRVPAAGGTPEEFIKGKENEFLNFPQILPDGKSVLFTINTFEGVRIAVQTIGSEERKELFPGSPVRYLPTGHLVYGLENTLSAVRFDLDTLEPIGRSVLLIQGVYRNNPFYTTQSAISDSGTLAYMPGGMGLALQSTLVWVDRKGNENPIEEEPKAYDDLKISPDGTRVALSMIENGNQDIYIHDLVRGTMPRLTFHEEEDFLPIWTPDGQRIIFGSDREKRWGIFWKAADGAGKVEKIALLPETGIWPYSISNDGKTLFCAHAGPRGLDIAMLSMEGDRTPKLLLQEEYAESQPQISPDGQWLAYVSNESGNDEVYVRPFPDVDSGRSQVSTSGGAYPLWSHDGRELFYRSGDSFMAVEVETEPAFKLGKTAVLFKGTYSYGSGLVTFKTTPWDVHPDGKRFLMLEPTGLADEASEAGIPRKINVVLNWFEELKERLPAD